MKGRNKRDNKSKYLLILLLLIAVGYAAIATTLKINGSAEIKSAKWDVYWENPQVIDGSVTETKPTLSESDTKATFDVTLNEPGDYYEFTIDAVNNGSLDAKIDTDGIIKQVKNASGEVVTPTILKYEVTNNDAGHTALEEGHILAKKSGSTPTKETYRVRVEYRNDEGINPSDLDDNDLVFTIEFSVKYVQGPKAEPAPDPYSMEAMCPNCKFGDGSNIKIGENIYYGGNEGNPDDLRIREFTDDYSNLNSTMFNGFVIENNIIERGFVCSYKDDNRLFCLEAVNGLMSDEVYSRNLDIINHFFSSCKMITDEEDYDYGSYKCDDDRIVIIKRDYIRIEAGSTDYNCEYDEDNRNGFYCS